MDEAVLAQALMVLWLCMRHMSNCHKAAAQYASNIRVGSVEIDIRRLRIRRRMLVNRLMDLQIQRQVLRGGRRWRLPRIRKLWFQQEVMKVCLISRHESISRVNGRISDRVGIQTPNVQLQYLLQL